MKTGQENRYFLWCSCPWQIFFISFSLYSHSTIDSSSLYFCSVLAKTQGLWYARQALGYSTLSQLSLICYSLKAVRGQEGRQFSVSFVLISQRQEIVSCILSDIKEPLLVKWVAKMMGAVCEVQTLGSGNCHVPPLTKSDGIYEMKCWQRCMWGGSNGGTSEKSCRCFCKAKHLYEHLCMGPTFKLRKTYYLLSFCSHGWMSKLREGRLTVSRFPEKCLRDKPSVITQEPLSEREQETVWSKGGPCSGYWVPGHPLRCSDWSSNTTPGLCVLT